MTKKNKPLVSVIIPTFNRGKQILDAINSVQCQTYKNYELIIVDDGSTDQTGEILQHLIDTKKIIYVKQTNKGPSAARNWGVKISKGNYIAFLDSDDLWIPIFLEVMLNSLLSSSITTGLVYSNCFNFNPDDSIVSLRYNPKHLIEGETNRFFLFRKRHIYNGSILIRKECFERIGGYDEYLRRYEDREFIYRFTKYFKIKVNKMPLVIITLHGASNPKDSNDSFNTKYEIDTFGKYLVDKLLNDVQKDSNNLILKHQIISRYNYVWGRSFFHQKNYMLATKYFNISLKNDFTNYRAILYLIMSLIKRVIF